jgi:L-threonylcarbamoyladenylate synthase
LPVIVGSFAQAQKYFIFSRVELALARRFWPGPLTLVLKTRSKKLAVAVGGNYVAVRWSANTIAARLAICAGAPITSTSANISGKPGCFTIASVKRQLGSAIGNQAYPDMFLNGGTLKRSLPSTIVRVVRDRIVVIREGKISTEELKSV